MCAQIGPFIKQFRSFDIDASGRLGVKDLKLMTSLSPEAVERASRANMTLKHSLTVQSRMFDIRSTAFVDTDESLLEVQQRLAASSDAFHERVRTERGLPASSRLHFACVVGSTDFRFSKDSSGALDGGRTTRRVLDAVGSQLAALRVAPTGSEAEEEVLLAFGGFAGIGEHMGRAFARARTSNGTAMSAAGTLGGGVYSILPESHGAQYPQLFKFVSDGKAPLAFDGQTVWQPGRDPAERLTELVRGWEDEEPHGDWKVRATFGDWDFATSFKVGMDDGERQRFLGQSMPIIIVVEGGPGARNEAEIARAAHRHVLPVGCLGGAAASIGTVGVQDAWLSAPVLGGEEAPPTLGELGIEIGELPSVTWLGEAVDPPLTLQSPAWRTLREAYAAMQLPANADRPQLVAAALCTLIRHVVTLRMRGEALIQRGARASSQGWGRARSGLGERAANGLLSSVLGRPTDQRTGAPGLLGVVSSLLQHNRHSADTGKPLAQPWHRPAATPPDKVYQHGALPTGLTIFETAAEVADFARSRGGHIVLVNGYDAKTQYFEGERSDFKRRLGRVVAYITERCGGTAKQRNWVAMYAGQPYDGTDCVDTAHVVRCLAEEYGVSILATQCDDYEGVICRPDADGGLGVPYLHLNGGGCLFYRTTWRTNSAGIEEIRFGGCDVASRQPIGASALWFSEPILPLVKYCLAIGGGSVTMQNVDLCLFGQAGVKPSGAGRGAARQPGGSAAAGRQCAGGAAAATSVIPGHQLPRLAIPVIYVPCRARNCGFGRAAGEWLGRVHDFVRIRQPLQGMLTSESRKRMMEPDPWFEFDPRPQSQLPDDKVQSHSHAKRIAPSSKYSA